MRVLPPRAPNGQYAWWLTGDTGARTLPAHSTCTHRKYRLTCAQYEVLVSRAAGACEVCGKEGHLTTKRANKGPWPGRLEIDHDHSLGAWAVRGLLCADCNRGIDRAENASALAQHNANAFYLTLLGAEVPASGPPEPAAGSVVLDYAFRRWIRLDDGWSPQHRYGWNRAALFTWPALLADSGPHNLTPYPLT